MPHHVSFSREATGIARLREEGDKRRFFLASLNWHPLRTRLIGENASFHTSFACGLISIALSFEF
jgi:hypothetical protein